MGKPWLSYEDQVERLKHRGLIIEEEVRAADFLARVSYYRASGYFRYWQIDPVNGDNRFLPGSTFATIQRVYDGEQELLMVCDELLHPLEVLLRTRFAHYYASLVESEGGFPIGEGFTRPDNTQSKPVEHYVLSNLGQSKEAFVAHYRSEVKIGNKYLPDAYSEMPIWVAVEAISFGTLSRMISASRESGVLDALASSMNTSAAKLPSQVRSFVYLRNRIAHCAKLWNHSVLDVPALMPNISRRVKRQYRIFSNHSIYKIFAALDDVATKSGIASGWLSDRIEPILNKNPVLAEGIANPAKYGEMKRELLIAD